MIHIFDSDKSLAGKRKEPIQVLMFSHTYDMKLIQVTEHHICCSITYSNELLLLPRIM